MQRNPVPITIFAIALSACVVEPELLNSERIKERFGSYGIDIFASHDGLRRSNLHSLENSEKICRTYAVVRFNVVPDGMLQNEHAQILDGASIGATFKANGWRVYKETRHVGDLPLPSNDGHLRTLMQLDGEQELAMHVYRLLLKKDSEMIDYAMIIEVHHPAYLGSDDVAALYVIDEPAQLDVDELAEMSALVLQAH